MSRPIVIAAILVTAILSATAAGAADVEARVQSVDSYARTVVLDNGTTLWLADGVALDNVKEGAVVKVSYEERDGKNVATSVEVK